MSQVIKSSHLLRSFSILTTTEYLITSGYDGNVIIKDFSNLDKILCRFMAYHRQEKGIKSAIISTENVIVTLGKNGCLIGFQLRFLTIKKFFFIKINLMIVKVLYIYSECEKETTKTVNSRKISPIILRYKENNYQTIPSLNQTWLEHEEFVKLKNLVIECSYQKNEITYALKNLKNKVKF